MMRILIVGSGPVSLKLLQHYVNQADFIIAADGGAKSLAQIERTADLLLGDMDSFPEGIPHERFPAEKNFTDLEAALERAQSKRPEKIWMLGCTGGRLDHFLSAVMLLFGVAYPTEIVDEKNRIQVRSSSFELKPDIYPYFSLVALDDVTVSIQGAKYELQEVLLKADQSLGISNEFIGETVRIRFRDARIILIESSDNEKTPEQGS